MLNRSVFKIFKYIVKLFLTKFTAARFMKKLLELLENDYKDFGSLENVEKTSDVPDSELWESRIYVLLSLIKEYYFRCVRNTETHII